MDKQLLSQATLKDILSLSEDEGAVEFDSSEELETAKKLVGRFIELDGRRPRMLWAKLPEAENDSAQKVLATIFADMGWDVDMGPEGQKPEEVVQDAADNDAHAIIFFSQTAEYKTLVQQFAAELERLDREDILLVIGGVPESYDYEELYELGASMIFAPDMKVHLCGNMLLQAMVDSVEE